MKNEGRVQPERPRQVVQEEEDLICPLYVLQTRNSVPPLQVAMEIDSHQLLMEVDTGAAYSLITDTTFKEFWPDRRLNKSDVRLCTYSVEPIEVLGSLTVAVKYVNQDSEEPLLVVKGTGLPLMGWNWMEHIRLDWSQITHYPAHACAKGLRNRFCPSVSLSVCLVKKFEIRTFTGLKDCCMRQ